MKRKIKLILATILLISGIIIFIYPIIIDYNYNNAVKKHEKEFDKKMDILNIDNNSDIENNNLNILYKYLEEENTKLFNNRQKSFINQSISYENTLIDLSKYNLDNNIIGFISIPSIDITLPIYLGASNKNMELGAVHLTGTSYPIGGNNTNSVIAAHRGYYKTKMFRHIDEISLGDLLYIKNFNSILTYKAVKTDIINPDELDKLTIVENKDMITIISCHPFPSNTKRYVVYFERI